MRVVPRRLQPLVVTFDVFLGEESFNRNVRISRPHVDRPVQVDAARFHVMLQYVAGASQQALLAGKLPQEIDKERAGRNEPTQSSKRPTDRETSTACGSENVMKDQRRQGQTQPKMQMASFADDEQNNCNTQAAQDNCKPAHRPGDRRKGLSSYQ